MFKNKDEHKIPIIFVSVNHQKYDTSGIIVLWALAESGIGGLLHALHFPFTGIFVGSFALISISLIAWYNEDPKAILNALSIVLAVKLLASPHSPWQAYVAVAFQGLAGYLLYHQKAHFKAKTIAFAIICLLESALQKLLIAVLIFGTEFLSAIDKSAINVADSLGFQMSASLVMWVFVSYTLLHLLVGIFLGIWIPGLPPKIDNFIEITSKNEAQIIAVENRSKINKWLIGFIFICISLVCFHFFLPENQPVDLAILLARVIVSTLLLTFVIGPIIKWIIYRVFVKNSPNEKGIAAVLSQLPAYRQKMVESYRLATQNYPKPRAYTIFLLGMLVFALRQDEK